jgi:hypothetical protein
MQLLMGSQSGRNLPWSSKLWALIGKMARPGRFELPTLCLEGRRSIQLSYGRTT